MIDFLISVVSKFINWITALYIRPTVKVTQFDIVETEDKKLNISFSALICNNTSKTFSVSQQVLAFFVGKTKVATIDVTQSEFEKKKDGKDGVYAVYPLNDISTLQPGEMKEIKIIRYKIDVDTVSKVRFSCFTGRKNCIYRIKVPKTDCRERDSTNEEITEMEKQIIKIKIKEWMKSLNGNIGAVTWISTVAIAVIATCFKFMWYVFQRGKLFYWNIDSTAISIIDDITLYNIFLMFLIGTIIIGVMLIPLGIVKSKMKLWWKIIGFVVLYSVFSIVAFYVFGLNSFVQNNGRAGIIVAGIVLIVLFICFFSPSLMIGIAIKPSKKARNGEMIISIKAIIICGILWVIMMTAYMGWFGYDSAKIQTKFRITGDGYAIIYETNDYYYLAEYDKESRSVIKEHQIIVKKENIEYFYSVN